MGGQEEFGIDADGSLVLKQPLDREDVSSTTTLPSNSQLLAEGRLPHVGRYVWVPSR